MNTCCDMNGKESNAEFRDGGEAAKDATSLAIKTLNEMSS
jgi:hypothetical protein